MASPTPWTWVWASSRSWWWTGKPGVLQSVGSQRVRYDWMTELNWLLAQWNNDTKEDIQFYACEEVNNRTNKSAVWIGISVRIHILNTLHSRLDFCTMPVTTPRIMKFFENVSRNRAQVYTQKVIYSVEQWIENHNDVFWNEDLVQKNCKTVFPDILHCKILKHTKNKLWVIE